ncbi:MAG: phospho-N-acetylmuramoyl-pentapeptide-transferase [Clostridiales bacterium]|nr:phospho-N-acetylmuramoyl-pentapeptide-transferase [Clostridiales bacterium]
MLYLINLFSSNFTSFLGILVAFLLTCFSMQKFSRLLPTDKGREFAHDGVLSAGKPRGAGFLFILVFVITVLIFGQLRRESIIYLVLVAAAMMTGFLDDCAKTSWGEYKKGFLDLLIAVMVAVTYLNFNSNEIYIAFLQTTVTIPVVVFGLLIVILVWTSINVTNCADGVDGLSGTLTIITLMSIYVINQLTGMESSFTYYILIFSVCILGYLWYNATPSHLMMGDAGSRAMGLFISIAILKTQRPLLYLLVAIVLILDGGLGLLKVSLLRFLKIRILKNTTTPLHDHVRKKLGWSGPQTVFRFAILQIIFSVAAVYLVLS